jgi:hypothetical protein
MCVRKLVRLGLAPSLLTLAGLVSPGVPAFADLSGPAVYEIEAKEQYCADGTTQCVAPNQRPNLGNLRFALFEAYRLGAPPGNLEHTANASAALPEALLAKCAGPHSIDARGNIHSTTMSVMVGPSGLGLHAGTVSGSVSLRHGLESDTRSSAVVALEATDPVTGDSAVVTGEQVANNVTDTLASGGFNITLRGPQYDEIVAGPDFSETAAPTPTGATGTMRCSTGNPTVTTPGAPPPYFESELTDAIDPAS